MKKYLIFFFIFFIQCSISSAQDQKKKNKDFFNIKAPAIEYSPLDTTEILFEDEFVDTSEASGSIQFIPHKELSTASEDTSTIDEGELSIVEVSEQMRFDTTWVTIAQYYSIWDSKSVNPYKIDASEFSDTIGVLLYDTAAGKNWSMPLKSTPTTSDFGMRHYRWHYGIDLKLDIGDPVMAAFDGIVRIQQYDAGGYGNYVMLRHYNGFETLYGHLTRAEVAVGQLVKAGDMIGIGGSTGRSSGPHLHFEVRYEGNAIDPESMYDFPNYTLRGQNFELSPAHFKYLKTYRSAVFHKIRSGETLSTISRKYRVSTSTICMLNRITTRTTLRVGRKLRIR